MKKDSKKILNNMAMIGMIAASGGLDIIPTFEKSVEPKNKYNLTEGEIELISTMSPKEKKKFLRNKK